MFIGDSSASVSVDEFNDAKQVAKVMQNLITRLISIDLIKLEIDLFILII